MKIKELSSKTGVSARMIRYYEEQGLLKPDRTNSGYRRFTSKDLITIRSIQSLQEAGLTLDAVRVLMPCIVSEPIKLSPCPLIIATLKQHRDKIKADLNKNTRALLLLDQFISDVTIFSTNV
ncbi:MerR family transcriptional regulator [Xenorhabdus bovienii]|uniref:Heavy metal-dependent transcription regulator 2 n=1 Tax=Xenorhabdus bovienii str. kraussei Becker Underwood TaxID=1398204 RepID=A0A077PT81_XENBV|nr:MerR family transcriptional regulator [Xenorhabdus bovienii]MCG3461467.1 MerR family transcriptional regulator [Xenorhabdus bovienii]CDH23787.1 Heavy metal-dependent transcription regulator 2 [Xenorhabdus bovienii str. kraussei Becker Underwood]